MCRRKISRMRCGVTGRRVIGRRVTAPAIAVAARITARTLAPLSAQEQCAVTRLLKQLG